MASKPLQLLAFTLLLPSFFPHFDIVSVQCHSESEAVGSSPIILNHNSHATNSSSLLFLNNLQGCRLGDTAQGIHRIKKYLQRFGYITNVQKQSNAMDHDDTFDNALESALKTYQKNFNLVASGILDANTLAQMGKPRCGVEDVINGTTWMRSGRERKPKMHAHFHLVSHFAFFEGNLKWPPSKFHLTYAFLPGYPFEAMMAVSRAFSKWAFNTHFTFSRVFDHTKADIKISFEIGDHGDDVPFDGVGGILAHAYAPTDGRLHFDGDEAWSVGAVDGYFDVETIALHEIGHVLGLQHSSIENAIMFPSISEGVTKGLHGDDIAGIRALYKV